MTSSQQLAHGLQPGTVLGNRYELLQFLGRGGFGKVFRARDRLLEIDCALKFLEPHLAEDQEQTARFKREILLGRKVRHENACQIFDFGEMEGYTFISMEFIDGWSLKDRLESEPAPVLEELLKIVAQVCDALDVAHRQGIIHRDLKLENLMLDRSGQVKVMDFGIAHSAETANMTSSNKLMGTPLYMAPERWRGDAPKAPSDIYALGVLMYQLFTGRPPFESTDFLVVCYNHVNDPPPPALSLNPSLPPALAEILERCLEKDPASRYQDAAELGRAIATVLTEGYDAILPADLGSAPTAGGEPAEATAEVRRSYVVPTLVGGMALLLIATLGLLAVLLLTPEPIPEVPRGPTPKAEATPAPTPESADPRLAETRAAAQRLYDQQVFITDAGDLDALRAYQRVLQLQPFDLEALERIKGIAAHFRKQAEIALDLGQYDQALDHYARAMKADPGALDLRQRFEAAIGQRKLAAEMQARLEAEERARLEAEERARREAEEKAKREAEGKARLEAEEKARLEAEAQAQQRATPEPEGWTPATARDRQQLESMIQEADRYVDRLDYGRALGILKRAEERFGRDPELKVRISLRRTEVVELAQASAQAVPPTQGPDVPVPTAQPSADGSGSIQFLVRPGAQVRVDGRLVGAMPIPPQRLAAGTHEIVLENAELGARLVKLVTLRAGQTLLIDEDLRIGWLDVETVPAARAAWRELPDGQFRELGMTPAKAQVPAGRDLELRLEAGGQTYRFQLRVPGGGRFAFRKTLAGP